LDDTGLSNIDAHGWSTAMPAPPWREPRAFWATRGEAWVAAAGQLFHFRDQAWSEAPLPIAEPLAFWAARPSSIWVVGTGGAAHFDGQAWRRLAVSGPLSAIVGRADAELWLGGEAGLFRLQP
jgi:hypothetical protein